MSTTVTYKDNTLTTVNNATRTLKTAGKYMEDDITLVDTSTPSLQSKTATPTESAQTITPDSGYDGLSSVSVGAISSTYVGTGITRRSSTDLTASGATVTVPAGYYSAQASKAVASGSPTAKVERVTDGALVTVTDAEGTTTAMLHDATGIASAADALMGDPSESTWATRESTGSGMARVESVQGAAVVWNQFVENGNFASTSGWVGDNCTISASDNVGTITIGSMSTTPNINRLDITPENGHTYYMSVEVNPTETMAAAALAISSSIYKARMTDIPTGWHKISGIVTTGSDSLLNRTMLYLNYGTGDNTGKTVSVRNYMTIDLTQMFGAGNEPATVAEFERMFPEAYYPYSAPTLKPVTIAGIRSTGRNLIDLNSPYGNGIYNAEVGNQIVSGNPTATPSGENPCTIAVHSAWNGVMFVSERLTVGNAYRLAFTVGGNGYRITIYTLDANHVITRRIGNYTSETQITNNITVKSNESYIALSVSANVAGTVFLTNTMLQVVTEDFNTYKPYTTDGVEWPTQTLRAAGSVRDELTAGELVARVGVVDLGTLTWNFYAGSNNHYFRTNIYDWLVKGTNRVVANVACAQYAATDPLSILDKTINVSTNNRIIIKDDSFSDDVNAFKASLNGVLCFYELATPTTTTISPALPMSYRIEQGGTESIVVPEGEISAAPVITVAEGESAADLVMDALSAIATPDGPVATANHAVGTYLTMDGALYRVTSAIAVGESIVAGTNVSQTTVMYDTRLVVLEYGVSTWDDFLAAYEANRLVYCRAPSTYGPRMAFLAYRATSGNTIMAEFQYYRSVQSHTDSQQGDEIYIYTLKPDNTWTTKTRQAYTRIVAGDGLKSTYANGVLTISLDQ